MKPQLPFGSQVLERARRSRDSRFDGRFYLGVVTTGVYCRPICPAAPKAHSRHVRYFATAAGAHAAGFRPCLRCRPETAPGTPAWLGTSAVVRRALRLIEDGALDRARIPQFAAQVGLGARQLDRLFAQHLGASPLALAQTRRLHFAKHLIDGSDLPMTEVALAAGYGSLRRFNDALGKAYGRPPRELRRQRPAQTAAGEVALTLAYRPPYDWQRLSAFLRARAIPGVEALEADSYARVIRVGSAHALIRVRPLPGRDALELRVSGAPAAALYRIAATARRVFDLTSDPGQITRDLGADRLLRALARALGDGQIDFDTGAETLAEQLTALSGFGAWTAQYVALRALGEPDALPEGDLILRRIAGGSARPLTARELRQRAESWRPWRGYATLHLWYAASETGAR